jgi:hypothetical protein
LRSGEEALLIGLFFRFDDVFAHVQNVVSMANLPPNSLLSSQNDL